MSRIGLHSSCKKQCPTTSSARSCSTSRRERCLGTNGKATAPSRTLTRTSFARSSSAVTRAGASTTLSPRWKTLHKSKDIEAYGTGIPRIKGACEEVGVEFDYKRVPIGTCFTFHQKDAFAGSDVVRDSSDKVPISSDKLASLIAEWGSLSETERTTCLAMAERGAVRSAEIATLTGLTQRGAQKALVRLVERGIAEMSGANRNRTYSLRVDLND